MKPPLALLAGLLFQSSPALQEGTPFEGAGAIISTLIPAYRPPSADAERALDVEGSHIKKWLRIPAALDKELQVGEYRWVRGIEKDGVLRLSEAIAFPGDGILRILRAPQPRNIAATFDWIGGGCNHMPAYFSRVNCRPHFSGSLQVANQRREPVEVAVERIFWSNRRDELGSSTDKLRVRVQTESGLAPPPFKLPAGQNQRIGLDYPMTSRDCSDVGTNVTVIRSINGERVFLRCTGEYSICH